MRRLADSWLSKMKGKETKVKHNFSCFNNRMFKVSHSDEEVHTSASVEGKQFIALSI